MINPVKLKHEGTMFKSNTNIGTGKILCNLNLPGGEK
jgi:hypothetical protein